MFQVDPSGAACAAPRAASRDDSLPWLGGPRELPGPWAAAVRSSPVRCSPGDLAAVAGLVVGSERRLASGLPVESRGGGEAERKTEGNWLKGKRRLHVSLPE